MSTYVAAFSVFQIVLTCSHLFLLVPPYSFLLICSKLFCPAFDFSPLVRLFELVSSIRVPFRSVLFPVVLFHSSFAPIPLLSIHADPFFCIIIINIASFHCPSILRYVPLLDSSCSVSCSSRHAAALRSADNDDLSDEVFLICLAPMSRVWASTVERRGEEEGAVPGGGERPLLTPRRPLQKDEREAMSLWRASRKSCARME